MLEKIGADYWPEEDDSDGSELEIFDKKTITLSSDNQLLGIRLMVKEVKTDAIAGEVTEISSKQGEYVIVDWSDENSKPSYMYVVHQFDKLVEQKSKSYEAYFLCYGGDRTGERDKTWPEIPVNMENRPPSKLYSITIKVRNRRS